MNALEYQKLAGYKYRVAAPFRVALPEIAPLLIENRWFRLAAGILTVNRGYAWDGASGPTIDTPATMAASLVHDVLYQSMRAGLLSPELRATADWILYRLMRAAERPWADARPSALRRRLAHLWIEARALYYFVGVRLFGAGCIKPRKIEPQDQIHVA